MKFCRAPGSTSEKLPSTQQEAPSSTLSDRLKALCGDFGVDFPEKIREQMVLDLGCGKGTYVKVLKESGAKWVAGIDFRQDILPQANTDDSLIFLSGDARALPFQNETIDVIFSKDSMEHFQNPEKVLVECQRVLRPNGKLCISFGPLWLAPYGAHIRHLTPIPWVHLMFSEQAVMAVRSRFHKDGAARYEDVEGGLNRMTLRKFSRLIHETGFKIINMQLYAVKGMVPLTSIPILREFFTNKVVCLVEKSS